jgi:hypothetical protein
MLIAFYDPKTNDVRMFSTDKMPAILVLSAGEADVIAAAKDQTRAHFFLDARKCLLANSPVELAKMERKLKETLVKNEQWPEYSAAGANSAQKYNPTDMGGA